jgi:hypothetical protein
MLPSDLPAVFAWDREIFGEDRSSLLASLFSRAPECAWVVGDAARLAGYTFGRPGYRYTQVGPIVASNRLVARDLLACSAASCPGRDVVLDAPSVDAEWLGLLQAAGFGEERRFLRMFRDGRGQPGVLERQYAICGPEFG